MTFDARESSRQLGSPVTLYLFRYGVDANAYHAFTDAHAAITYDNVTYNPEPIQHGAITSSGSLDRSALEIKVPKTNPLGSLFLVYPPAQVVTLILYKGHLEDSPPDFRAVWNGRVINCAREGSEMTLTCDPVAASMRRSGLRRNYQHSCPHVLYQQGDFKCNADQAAATITRTVAAVDDNVVTLSAGWDSVHPASKYIGGMISWDNEGATEYRTILRITGGVDLVTNGFVRGLAASDSVDVILGCNHSAHLTEGDCLNLHVTAGSGSPPTSNIHNFGGQPWRPKKNPMGNTSPFV